MSAHTVSTKKNGIYDVVLSRKHLEEFIKTIDTNKQIKPLSLNDFAQKFVNDPNAKVIVDFSIDTETGQNVDLNRLDFSNADISGVKFSGANMEGCKFENAILDSADFSGAILDKAVFKNCRAVSANFNQAALNNVTIDNSDFGGAVFAESQSNLLKINNKSNLRSAKLDNAKIDRLEAENCDLRQSSFNHSVIKTLVAENCDFKQSHLDNANIEKAIIRDSDFSNCSMQKAKMPRAELTNVKLNNVNASEINLHEAVIKSDCQLKNVNFSAADLSYADLNGCIISNADLSNVNLLKANLEGASISRVRQDKAWYKPSSETLIKSTVGASKVALGASKVVTSGAKFTKNMFSKLWRSGAPVPQEAIEAEIAQNDVSKQSNSQHYNNIVNAITSTRLVAEDFVQAKSFVENITKVVAGLFDQDYFFPRANNYQVLVEQVEKAHAKGYIDDKYKEVFLKELKKIEIDESQYKTLPHQVLERLLIEKEDKIPRDKLAELAKKLVDNKQENDKEINAVLQEIIPLNIIEERHKLQAPKIAAMQQYYGDRHAEFTHYMLTNRLKQFDNSKTIITKEEENKINARLDELTPTPSLTIQKKEEIKKQLGKLVQVKPLSLEEKVKINERLEEFVRKQIITKEEESKINERLEKLVQIWPSTKDGQDKRNALLEKLIQEEIITTGEKSQINEQLEKLVQENDITQDKKDAINEQLGKLVQAKPLSPEEKSQINEQLEALVEQEIITQDKKDEINEWLDKLVQVWLLTKDEQDKINGLLRDKAGRFEEKINYVLEKNALMTAADKLKPLLHVLSDPKLFEITQLLGSGQNREQTLAIVDSLKKNIGLITQKLTIANPIENLVIEDTLLQYVGIAPSIISLIIPMMKYQEEFSLILSGLQDMFRAGDHTLFADGSKRPNDTMNAIRAICTLLQRDPELRRSFSEEIEKMTKVLTGIFAETIQSTGLEVDFINKLTSFSTKLAQAENSEIFGLCATVIAVMQDPKSALESMQKAENYSQLKDIIQEVLPRFIENQNADMKSLIEQFLMKTVKGSEINNLVAVVLRVNTTESLELQAYMQVISSVVDIAGVMMNHQDECLEIIKFFTTKAPTSEQYAQVLSAGIRLLSQKNVREVLSQKLPIILDLTKDVLENKLKSFGLSQEFAVQAVGVLRDMVDSDEMGKILKFAEGIVSLEIIDAYRNDPNKLPELFINSIKDEKKYNQLQGVIQTSLPSLLKSNKDNINGLIGEFLQDTTDTTMGQKINNLVAAKLGIDASKALVLKDSYLGILESVVDIAGVAMNHQDEFLELIKFFTTKEPTSEKYLQVLSVGMKLLSQKNVREVLSQKLPIILDLTKDVLENKLKSFGLSQEFAVQAVGVLSDIIASDAMVPILEFAEGIVNEEMIEARGDYPKLFELVIDSIKEEEKYNQLKGVIQTSLSSLLASNKDNINLLIGEFLRNTTMGQEINKQVASVLGIDAIASLKLQDGYTAVASSAVHIAAVAMNHKTDFMLLMDAAQRLWVKGDEQKQLADAENNMSHYLQTIASGVKLLKQQDVRAAISQELPKIFAATNGVLAANIKEMGLSYKFAEQSVDLLAKVVASEEMGKILEFADDLLMGGITLDRRGQMLPSKVMNQMIEDIRGGNYKAGFQGFVSLVGNAGKYKELRALVQETLPALITKNKEQIVPLMEEFIKNTALGQKINIDVNDILKIASKKNKNFVDLANYWAKGSYSGILKETVKLLTSPMVAAFLLEIAGKVAWSYLFEGKKEVEQTAQVLQEKVPAPDIPVKEIPVQEVKNEHVSKEEKNNVAPRKREIIIGRQRITTNISEEKQKLHSRKAETFDPHNKPKKSKNQSQKLATDESQGKILETTDQETIEKPSGVGIANHQNNLPRAFAPKKAMSSRPLKRGYRTKKEIKPRSSSHRKNVTEERERPGTSAKSKGG